MGVGANLIGASQNPGNPSGRLTDGDRGLWLSMQAIRRQLAAMPVFAMANLRVACRLQFPADIVQMFPRRSPSTKTNLSWANDISSS